jgi:hypothetical protein
MRRFLLTIAFSLLSLPAVAQLLETTPGFQSYIDGAYTHFDGYSTQLITRPYNIYFNGSVTPGDTVGFDYSYNYQGGRKHLQFRHTMAAGETIRDIAFALAAQFKGNSDVNAVIGADIVSYALVRQTSPTTWWFQFFQKWPFVNTGNIILTPVSSATMTVSYDAGGPALEVNPYVAFGRSTIAQGRQPQSGDNIFGMYVTGDVTNQPVDLRNVDPTYFQLQWHIIDPTPGVASASMTVIGDTVDFKVKNLLINGAPASGFGPQGPPGGNIAGSIVQSPALTICADQNQTGNNCTYTRVYKLGGLNIRGWTTIATLTPSNVAGSWSMSKMKVEMVTNTNGLGPGTLESQAYIQIANAAPAGNYIGANTTIAAASKFKFVPCQTVSICVQVASPDESHFIAAGFAKIEYFLSDAEGNPVTWTIN